MDAPCCVRVERTDDPHTLRWIFLNAQTPSVTALETLFAHYPFEKIVVEPDAVLITASSASFWTEETSTVHHLLETVAVPKGAATADITNKATQPTVTAINQIIDETIGAVLKTHGGEITLVSHTAEEVVLLLTGACVGCPGAASTIFGQLLPALQAAFPATRFTVQEEQRQRLRVLRRRVMPQY